MADDVLAAALARGATIEDAATEAGVGISTAHRRLKEPGFAGRVAALHGEMVGRTVGLLSTVANNAVLTLVKLLDSKDERVQLGAARSILDTTFRGSETTTFAAQVEALRAELEAMKNGSGDADARSVPDAVGGGPLASGDAATEGPCEGVGPEVVAADEPA